LNNKELCETIKRYNLQKFEENINNLIRIIPNWREFFIEKLQKQQVDTFSQYRSAWVLADLTYFVLGELQQKIKDVEEIRVNISNDFNEIMSQ